MERYIKRTCSAAILLLILLSGCSLLKDTTSHLAYRQLTELKTFHLGFIDHFTEEERDTTEMNEMFAEGRLMFDEAIEDEKTGANDNLRLNTFSILLEQFTRDYEYLKKKKKYTEPAAGWLKEEVEENYTLALKGEQLNKKEAK